MRKILPYSPRLSNQKYNAHLKEVGKLAGLTGDWITEKQSGREVTVHTTADMMMKYVKFDDESK